MESSLFVRIRQGDIRKEKKCCLHNDANWSGLFAWGMANVN